MASFPWQRVWCCWVWFLLCNIEFSTSVSVAVPEMILDPTISAQIATTSTRAKSKSRTTTIYSESAILDRESGRVFWQTRSPRILDTLLLSSFEVQLFRHLRAMITTTFLFLPLLHAVVERVKSSMSSSSSWWRTTKLSIELLSILPLPHQKTWPLWVALYLLEAWTCTTHRGYLRNSLSSAEDYLDGLRKATPQVRWKVRCYHYDENDENNHTDYGGPQNVTSILSPSFLLWRKLLKLPPPKVITHTAETCFQPTSWNDKTTVSVWKRAEAATSRPTTTSTVTPTDDLSLLAGNHDDNETYGVTHPKVTNDTYDQTNYTTTTTNTTAQNVTTFKLDEKRKSEEPANSYYAKVTCSKLVVLGDEETRRQYMAQQKNFVAREGNKDTFAEFSTSIEVNNFRPKLLLHPGPAKRSHVALRFWLFTLLGLTLPFRIWFDRQCASLCVTLVKETYAVAPPLPRSPWLGWVARAQRKDRDTSVVDRNDRDTAPITNHTQAYGNGNGNSTAVETPTNVTNSTSIPVLVPSADINFNNNTNETAQTPSSLPDVFKDDMKETSPIAAP